MKAKNIFLALGSNIGDRAANLMSALSFLQGHGAEVLTVSSFYETEAIGPKQRSFYNAVLEAKTVLSPLKLLSFTQSVQKAMGRKESARWMPRIIDIDILFFGDMIIKERGLTVPHEMICERLFVLAPLFEIAKDFVHPVLRKSIAEILKEKSIDLKNQKICRLGDRK
jgi:2-amino-4-hydroxy-6-hydroxymethyldihydropteridine diphosphokinase